MSFYDAVAWFVIVMSVLNIAGTLYNNTKVEMAALEMKKKTSMYKPWGGLTNGERMQLKALIKTPNGYLMITGVIGILWLVFG